MSYMRKLCASLSSRSETIPILSILFEYGLWILLDLHRAGDWFPSCWTAANWRMIDLCSLICSRSLPTPSTVLIISVALLSMLSSCSWMKRRASMSTHSWAMRTDAHLVVPSTPPWKMYSLRPFHERSIGLLSRRDCWPALFLWREEPQPRSVWFSTETHLQPVLHA